MKKQIFCMALGFWMIVITGDILFTFLFFLLYGLYLYSVNQKLVVLFLWLLCCLFSLMLLPQSIDAPVSGEYTVYRVKKNYALAQNQNDRIILYGLKDPGIFDTYYVETFEKVYSLDNISMFSFSSYLKEEKIAYSAQVSETNLISKGHTFSSKIFNVIHNKDPFLFSILYGIYDDNTPDLIYRLSLPLLSFLYLLENFLKKHLSYSQVYIVSFFTSLICGFLFDYTTSLVRFICHRFSKIFFKDLQNQISMTIVLFLVLLPQKGTSFSFVLPIAFSLLNLVSQNGKQKMCLRLVLLTGLQYLYFHQVDFVLLLIFGFLRKMSGYCLIVEIFLFFFPFYEIQNLWFSLLENIPSLIWEFDAGFIYLLFMLITLFKILCANKNRIYLLVFFLFPFFAPYTNPFFTVTVFSIGQGDCTLITEPFLKSAVMIDCGQNLYRDNMEEIVIPFLKMKHIHQLDCVILTHNDFDHDGGIDSLKKQIHIKKIITERKGTVPVSYPFYSLLEEREANDKNDESIISYFSYDNTSFLWMGDASKEIEKDLIHRYPNLKADLLKVGHHGSNTSSCFEFLDATDASLAIISAGKDNRYGHPHVETLKNLKRAGISNLNTGDTGMIRIYTLKGLRFFITGSKNFGIIP